MFCILSSVGSNFAKRHLIYLQVTRVDISVNSEIPSDCRGARGKSTCGWYREKFNQNSSVASSKAITIFQIDEVRARSDDWYCGNCDFENPFTKWNLCHVLCFKLWRWNIYESSHEFWRQGSGRSVRRTTSSLGISVLSGWRYLWYFLNFEGYLYES